MALLDLCRKEGDDIAVAHVNYKKRPTADRDEQIVRAYCQRYEIPFYIDEPVWEHQGNFQAWARDVRYAFFERCADDFGTKCIATAHQMDDVLETYLFQKQSGRIPSVYGIAPKSERHGYQIERPLLDRTKNDLQDYCEKQRIAYGIDESNLSDDYTRNQIRHHQLAFLSRKEKEAMLVSIKKENEALKVRQEKAQGFLSKDWRMEDLLQQEDALYILDTYLYENTGKHYAKKHLSSLLEQVQSDCLIDLETHEIESFHGKLFCLKKESFDPICFSKIDYVETDVFSFRKTGKTIEGFTVEESDFPLLLRRVQAGDTIDLRYGKKKVSRFFIDRKIPKIVRRRWLVLENAKKQVIFVPGIGCDREHFSTQPTAFMVQCTLT